MSQWSDAEEEGTGPVSEGRVVWYEREGDQRDGHGGGAPVYMYIYPGRPIRIYRGVQVHYTHTHREGGGGGGGWLFFDTRAPPTVIKGGLRLF